MKTASWLTLIIGIWLLGSPLLLDMQGTMLRNNGLFGVLAILVAISSLWVTERNHAPAWINVAFGVWTFLSPWFLGATMAVTYWNNAIAGALLVAFALLRTVAARPPLRPMA